ncbi:16S rRNA (cytosine(967)-C(5))-methyltransferase [Planktothricoides raciborskii]|uniref:16S rRNA (cytosine(967)-C(5))-methyltransferase n=2 Tax=Planktothricoides raciborskii TaxID=132608 RepID=A0AAU8JEM5_9CYAN|nr:16S rRNA (cytosine(967)-C(5))-methyltransferase [Planktothricoides raciborskii]MBD2544377.1 16S rRNA (cytosine(967)-C(5))-methyltransferase [Planktothricoides raciborskii FACHB-1370]MBD2582224.1 16S rRNA (cytosine(967)-C(5))-methyltransferase [Planktothricoides raciborskii FACHB-1261]
MQNSRQIAFLILRDIHRRGAFADVALDKWLRQVQIESKAEEIKSDRAESRNENRALVTELVYGCVRRMRSLDALIDLLAKKPADKQPPDLRIILHIGFYQLRYLNQISAATAVDTTVELAKTNGMSGLTGVVNGLLRQYLRQAEAGTIEDGLIKASGDSSIPGKHLGIIHSYPDWIVNNWLEQLGLEETEQLCEWFNQSPTIDLRVNPLRSSVDQVETALQDGGVKVSRLPALPQGLRLTGKVGAIAALPGYEQGWWTIQDSSAQLVTYLLDPQPDSVVIDACAAPGGKTTHIAELMGDKGTIWACDRTPSRLKKVKENAHRLQLKSIQTITGDSRKLSQFKETADFVLLDAPCSGLGTLHRRADIRWRQTPENIQEICQLQRELLEQVCQWVKPGGILVYSTCTLYSPENEEAIADFLSQHHDWQIELPKAGNPAAEFITPEGWIKVWPHRHIMDGFFMVRLRKTTQ